MLKSSCLKVLSLPLQKYHTFTLMHETAAQQGAQQASLTEYSF